MLGNGAARYVHAGFPCFFFFVLGVSYLVGGMGGGGLGNLGELRLGEGSHSSLSSPRFPKPPPPLDPPPREAYNIVSPPRFFGIDEGIQIPGLVNVYSLRTGKSPSPIGKSTINGPCSIAMLNYQRVDDICW